MGGGVGGGGEGRRFTYVSHSYSTLPIHVFATYTLSLPVIFATWHNKSHPDLGKDSGIILKLNGGDMTHLYIYLLRAIVK